MPLTIRTATRSDIDAMTDLLVADARGREAGDPLLWKVATDAARRVATALRGALSDEPSPIRHRWLLAEAGGAVVGVGHTILLPVPPIYAGAFGPPGLVMEDCTVAPDAPEGTVHALLEAAEADLVRAGARVLLASSVPGGTWEAALGAKRYAPLTRYLARTGLRDAAYPAATRPARAEDVPEIVRLSAAHRDVLNRLERFWEPHPEADARFGAWMEKSLTLPDRDMVVCRAGGALTGYAVAQPATPLHFPPSHDIAAVGVIDDFHHAALADPDRLGDGGAQAAALLRAAEAARRRRANDTVMVVCPAAWTSKIALLEAEGFANAISWYIRRPD